MNTEKIRFRLAFITIGSLFLGIFIGTNLTKFGLENYMYNTSESLPEKLFKIEDSDGTINKGDYISFCPTKKILQPMIDMKIARKSSECLLGYEPHLKIVGAVENDYLRVKDDGIYVNGIKIRSDLRPYYDYLSQFKYDGIVPKNMMFVYGTNEKSYDSRYYGFISKDKIIKKVKPVF